MYMNMHFTFINMPKYAKKYAQTCRNMDFPKENTKKMQQNAEKYAKYAEVHIWHISQLHALLPQCHSTLC
jgi:hypothetical protein